MKKLHRFFSQPNKLKEQNTKHKFVALNAIEIPSNKNEKLLNVSTEIILSTPKNNSSFKPTYEEQLNSSGLKEKNYKRNMKSLCLMRGDLRSPELIESCGGFHPWGSIEAYDVLNTLRHEENPEERKRLISILDGLENNKLLNGSEIDNIMETLVCNDAVKHVSNNSTLKILQEFMKVLKPIESKLRSPERVFDPIAHKVSTKYTASGFVSFTDSLKTAKGFANDSGGSKGFIYVVRARGSVEEITKFGPKEREYLMPGGLDWTDVIGYRMFDMMEWKFVGALYINEKFVETNQKAAKKMCNLLRNETEKFDFKNEIKRHKNMNDDPKSDLNKTSVELLEEEVTFSP